MRTTMRNLQLDTYTSLQIEDLDHEPGLRTTDFDLRRLEGR
jgi:hypothetical protein